MLELHCLKWYLTNLQKLFNFSTHWSILNHHTTSTMTNLLANTAKFGAFLSIAVALYLRFGWKRIVVPEHLANHKLFVEPKLISPTLRLELMEIVKEMKEFYNNVDQTKAQGFTPTHAHIGEAEPLVAGEKCSNTLLYPNANKTLCLFPDRVDIGKHFILTGGLEGKKEKVAHSIDRLSSFARYNIVKDENSFPSAVKQLIDSDVFQKAAKAVCPAGLSTHLDPFQFNFIIQVPGQSVALHLDPPYFFGANRFHFPQWLLVAMEFSNLFAKDFVHQIQVVAYIHEWEAGPEDAGEFVYFPNDNTVGTVSPQPGAGTIIDGSKTIHAAKIYRPNATPPHLPKNDSCTLTFLQGDDWGVVCKEAGILAKYTTHDLRISTVYRARCFSSPEEAADYADRGFKQMMPLEQILGTFIKDMVTQKKVLASEEKGWEMPRFDLAQLIIETYIKYPYPSVEDAWLPINFCALPLVLPWTSAVIDLLCP